MKWIKTEDELPPLNTKVLVTDGEGKFWIGERWQEKIGKREMEYFKSVICTCCSQDYDYAESKFWMVLPKGPDAKE